MNLSRPAERVVAFHNRRRTAGQWIKEGKNAIKWARLSRRKFRNNKVRLQLHARAYNLANIMRTLTSPSKIDTWRLTKTGTRLVRHARYAVLQLTNAARPLRLEPESITCLIHEASVRLSLRYARGIAMKQNIQNRQESESNNWKIRY